MTEQGGARANKSGRVLESLVENVIRGFAPSVLEVPWREWQQTDQSHFPALIRHVPYTTLYGTQGKSEFVLFLISYPRAQYPDRMQMAEQLGVRG